MSFCTRNALSIVALLIATIAAGDSLAKTNANLWRRCDVEAMCDGRWQNQPSAIKSCIARNQRKIGKEKTPGEIQELEALQPEIEKPKPTTQKD